jgi:serine protease inhibitor
MKMKNGVAKIFLLIIILLLGTAGTYYIKNSSNNSEPIKESTRTEDLKSNSEEEYNNECPPPDCVSDKYNRPPNYPLISSAHNKFGIDLIKTIWQTDKGKNIFISPSSVAIALSMVYNGAKEETKTAMKNILHFEQLEDIEINQGNIDIMDSLKSIDMDVQLSIANSVWAKQGMVFNNDFISILKNSYKAESSVLDFNNPESIKTINAWVNKNTNQKITKIIDNIPSNMVMYVINAIYFKGSWTNSFDKKLTENRDFSQAPGYTPRQVPMMKETRDFSYLENDDFQSVKLDYGKNKEISMYVFLPKVSVDKFINNLTKEKFDSWMKMYSTREGTLFLPKVKIEYEKQLKENLTALGMGIAFENNANLSGIGENLKISEVKHKTFVDINEEGTEAAAVTSIGIAMTAVRIPDNTFYMEVNRPFFFTIRDNTTEEILFMGIIQNP